MENQPFQTSLNQYVRLKMDGQDALYPFAGAGSPGWVRKQQHDRLGYPQVFIEWDKNHWSYNGEPDKWAMEAHFEPLENAPMSDQSQNQPTPENMAQMFAAFQQFMADQSQQPAQQETNDTLAEDYKKSIETVIELLNEADSYIVITTTRVERDGRPPAITPRAINFYKSVEGGMIAELQLSKMAAMSHEEQILRALSLETNE